MRTSTQHNSTVLLDTRDLASRLTPPSGEGPSPRTLERWRSEGNGPPYVKVGRRAMYREADVERWLQSRTRSFAGERVKTPESR
jgi:Helix-turn-helix domain